MSDAAVVEASKPWYADRSFLLIAINVAAIFVTKFFGVSLNVESLATDAALVLGFVGAHKAATAKVALALIEERAKARYLETPPAPVTAPEIAKALDKPVTP